MSGSVPLNSARRTVSILAAGLFDADGIKTSVTSSTSLVTYSGADFNGGSGISTTTGVLSPLPRVITISRSSAANQYSVLPITVIGRRGGVEITETLTPANDDGNDTLVTLNAFSTLTSVTIPANAGAGGAYTIGFRDIAAPLGDRFTGVMPHASGNLIVQYNDNGTAAQAVTDTIPGVADHIYPIAPYRIITGAAGTAVGVTVYLP